MNFLRGKNPSRKSGYSRADRCKNLESLELCCSVPYDRKGRKEKKEKREGKKLFYKL